MQQKPESEERWQDEGERPAGGLRLGPKLSALITVGGAVFTFLFFVAVFSQLNLTLSNHTKDMTIVDIELDGWKPLRIPKAYLDESRSWRGGDQDYVSIRVVYPSMLPRTLVPGYKKEDLIFITLMAADKDLLESENFQKNKKMRPYIVPTEFGIGKLSDSYYADEKLGKAPFAILTDGNDYYMAILPKRFVKVECSKKGKSLCKGFTNFDEHITGYFLIPRRLMPEYWQELDKKIITLTDSFINFKDSEEE